MSDGQNVTVKKLSLPQAIVGESIRWHPKDQALIYVDILGQQLRRFDPVNESYNSWEFDAPVGGWYPTTRETLLLGVGLDLVEFDMSAGEIVGHLCTLPGDAERLRINEGRCDANGRLWVSTMSRHPEDQQGAGALYCVGSNGQVEQFLDGLTIPNTLCWSPDNRKMYFADSLSREVMVFDYDIKTGRPTNRQVFFALDESHAGIPDGAAVDSDGYVWIAMPRSGRVERRSPNGALDQTLMLPCERPTMCAFGGASLNKIYISSLSFFLPPEERASNHKDGYVYELPTHFSGIKENSFVWEV
jgi:sugar lactone lactonase YvrE